MRGRKHTVFQTGCDEHGTGLNTLRRRANGGSQAHDSTTCGHLLEHSAGLEPNGCASRLSGIDQRLIKALPRECPTAWQAKVERSAIPAKTKLIERHATLISDQIRKSRCIQCS